jgi:hypothetical protein
LVFLSSTPNFVHGKPKLRISARLAVAVGMNCGKNQPMCWDFVKWDIVTDEDFNKGVIVRSQDICELVDRCDSSKPSCPRVKNGFHIHTRCMPGKSRPKLVLKHCLSDGDGDRTSEILEERYSTRSDSDLMSGHLFLN